MERVLHCKTEDLTPLSKVIGVYVLRDSDNRVIYVGKAFDAAKRVKTHLKKPWNISDISVLDLTYWSAHMDVFEINAYLSYKETCLIQITKPIRNLTRPELSWEVIGAYPPRVRDMVTEATMSSGLTSFLQDSGADL